VRQVLVPGDNRRQAELIELESWRAKLTRDSESLWSEALHGKNG